MAIEVKIIEDSISAAGKRVTTFQVKYHRFILPEANTHRVLSRNYSSSRAIPTAKLLEQVRNDPAMPVFWGKNMAGMQAKEELTGNALMEAQQQWRMAANQAADRSEMMAAINVHKQISNRVLEPFLWVHGVITATELDNWFELRAHEDAQPEIQALAYAMLDAVNASTPKLLKTGEWHLPYVTEIERNTLLPGLLPQISAARCCRVSYLKHDGTNPSVEEDLALCERLVGARPLHASPFEHPCTPDSLLSDGTWASPKLHGNFVGWNQYRKTIEEKFK